jgi:tetratricopeptide (TPR) repeat protein
MQDAKLNIEHVQREAERHMMAANYEAALEQYNLMHCIDTMSYVAALGVGECLQRLGRWAESRDWYYAALRRFPSTPEINLRLASIEVETGNLPNAKKLFVELTSAMPSNRWVWIGLADVAQRSGNAEDAEATLLETLTRLGPHQDILLRLAHMSNASHDFVRAADYFEQARACISAELECHPGHEGLAHQGAQVRIDLALATARAAKASGSLANAIEKLEAEFNLAPSSVLKQHLATLHFENDDVHAVIRILNDTPVTKLESQSLIQLIVSLARSGKMEEPVALISAVDSITTLQELAVGLSAAGVLRLAVLGWEKLTNAAPGIEMGFHGLVHTLLAVQDIGNAIAAADRGLHYFPNSLQLLDQRAHLHYEIGDSLTAYSIWSDNFRRDSTDIYAVHGILWALSSLGRYEEAYAFIDTLTPQQQRDEQVQLVAARYTTKLDVAQRSRYSELLSMIDSDDSELGYLVPPYLPIEDLDISERILWDYYRKTRSTKALWRLLCLYQPGLLGRNSTVGVAFLSIVENITNDSSIQYAMQIVYRGYHNFALNFSLSRCRDPFILLCLSIVVRNKILEIKILQDWYIHCSPPISGSINNDLMSLRAYSLAVRGALHSITQEPDLEVKAVLENQYARGAKRLHVYLSRLRSAAVPRSQQKIRVAVCISGQLRGYKSAFPSLRKALAPACDFDVFVHTWERVGGNLGAQSTYERFFPPECRKSLPDAVWIAKNFEAMFRHTSKLILAERFVNTTEIREFFGAADTVVENETDFEERWKNEEHLIFNGTLNQAKMFYKMNACNNSKNIYAKKHNINYDLVIRIRPDMEINYIYFDEILKFCNSNLTICSNFIELDNMGDQFGVGRPIAMDIYCSIWKFMVGARTSHYLPGIDGYGDRLLGRHLIGMGMDVALLHQTRMRGLGSATVPPLSVKKALEQDLSAAIAYGLSEPVLLNFIEIFSKMTNLD